jgi:D-beta-D-heptose 7-phosphate kinase/D-beta-D-heptose 1-phosphate adenosyltransferase
MDVFIISDYGKGIFNHEAFAYLTIDSANRAGIPTIVDTKPRHFNRFRDATVILCTLKEAKEFIRMTRFLAKDDVEEIGNMVLEMIGCKCLVIVQEEKGFKISVFGENQFVVDGVTKKVYDSVGLEDTVTSVLALSLAAGLDMKESMELVIRAVSIVASKPGTQIITKKELLATF